VDPATTAAAGAANPAMFLSAGTALGGDLLGYFGQQQTNAMNERMVQQQENFQLMMSNTAHQREVADLRAAGLNPILSANNSGASTTSGAIAPMSSPMQPLSQGISGSAKQLTDTMQAFANVDNSQAQAQNQRAQAKLAAANASVASKTASEKAPFAQMGEDASKVYGAFHDKMGVLLDKLGINSTNAGRTNWFFGSPNPQEVYHLQKSTGGN